MSKGYTKGSYTLGVVVKKASRRRREKRLLLSPDEWEELKVVQTQSHVQSHVQSHIQSHVQTQALL